MTVPTTQSQEIFKDIELAGANLKAEFRKMSEIAQKRMDSLVQSAKFEAAYALTISKEQRIKTMDEIKEVRNDLWEEALRKANGNVKKAHVFYEEFCSFP